MWAVGDVSILHGATLKNLGRPAETLKQVRLVFSWSIKEWKWLRQEGPSIVIVVVYTLQTNLRLSR